MHGRFLPRCARSAGWADSAVCLEGCSVVLGCGYYVTGPVLDVPGRPRAGGAVPVRPWFRARCMEAGQVPFRAVAGWLICRTLFRIVGVWLVLAAGCIGVSRGRRRSWSWQGTGSGICCAGRGTSGTGPGMRGCRGCRPPGIRSATGIMSSACARVRCGSWSIRAPMNVFRGACSATTARSGRGPRWPDPEGEVAAVLGTQRETDDPARGAQGQRGRGSTGQPGPGWPVPGRPGVPAVGGVLREFGWDADLA